MSETKKMIGRRLKKIRESRGYTLEELATKTGGLISKQRISNYESGIREPNADATLRLAMALDVHPSEITYGNLPNGLSEQPARYKPTTTAIAEIVDTLSDEEARSVRDVAEIKKQNKALKAKVAELEKKAS